MKPRLLLPAVRLALVLAPLSVGAAHAQSTVLYASDFEADGGGFVSVQGEWEHGVPTGPGGVHSGAKCWATDLDGQPDPGWHYLDSPVIDASAAAGADAILVRWWQYFDEQPIVFPYPTYRAYVRIGGGLSSQDLFGRDYDSGFDFADLPHIGWREVTAVLGPDYAVADLQLVFSWLGINADGFKLDDVSVEALHTTTVSSEDFEAGPGGFSGNWGYGSPSGCPLPAEAASGVFCWSTDIFNCSYGFDQTLLSPVIDLSPYANREEVYLAWNRSATFEVFGDGAHHQVSYDGGATFELASGWHHGAHGDLAHGFLKWTSYGLVLDPARGTDVQLRLRVITDFTEFEYAMTLDDFRLLVPEEVLGSGHNPPGSLFVSAGSFGLGASVELSVDDPGASFPAGSLGYVAIALGPDPLLPAGTPIPGLGMDAPGATGDLLVDLGTLVGIAGGAAWAPGAPAKVALAVPASPTLAGVAVWFQGALVDAAPSGLRVGLTTGLYEVLGL